MASDKIGRQLVVGLVSKTKETDGGASNYENNLVAALRRDSSVEDIRFIVFHPKGSVSKSSTKDARFSRDHYSIGSIQHVQARLLSNPFCAKLLRICGLGTLSLERAARKKRVDLLYFLSPNQLAAGIQQTPMINTVWDLGHLDEPAFPEVSSNGEWISRQTLYNSVLPRSFHVFTDSRFTGIALESHYQVRPNRWTCLGLFPPAVLKPDETSIRNSSRDYIIYPAQFWPHKNHITLLRAFKLVLEKLPNIHLVLTGGDKGNRAHVLKEIKALKIQDKVELLGFVPETQLKNLIKDAAALVMPSMLGPTNIPPLEALAAGTVAIVSDIHHFDAEISQHLIFARGLDVEDWAEKIASSISIDSKPVDVTNEHAIRDILNVLEDFRVLRDLWM